MKILFISLTAILLSLTALGQKTGTPMPDAIFYNRDNSTFSTHNIPAGKQSFVIFFDATCSHCQKIVGEIDKRTKELSKLNIYLVSQDEYKSIDYFTDNFAKQLSRLKNVTVVQDRNHVFIMAFHPQKYPALYLYGPDKKLELSTSGETDVNKFFKLIKR
jgi:peroxiredoxin